MTPNTTFAAPIENPDLNNDGFPWINDYRSEFSEFGLGVLFDVELGTATNLLIGGRVDGSQAKNVDHAGRFNPAIGTSANPGAFSSADCVARAWDHGTSWSVSLSRRMPYNVRPYVTFARSSIVLDGNSNALTNAIINAGHIGSAQLREAGIKAALMDNKMFFTSSAYEQRRMDVSANDDPAVINSYPTATVTRGWEMELKWVPLRNLFVSAYALKQTTKYDPNIGAAMLVDARTLGFQDVVDGSGNVIYPAEAFLYGGRSRLVLPSDMPQYATKQGNPSTQVGADANFQLRNGLGFTLSGNYFSSTCSGRLCLVNLPESYVVNLGAFWELPAWSVKLDVMNLTDERYFRARTGDTLGDVLAQAMPDRRWQLTVKASF
jgi:hypothetical protein